MRYCTIYRGITAENLASDFDISRQASDEYAVQSQERWAAANSSGVFSDEIVPLELKGKKGPVSFDTDEHPRLTPLDKMAKLATTFKKDGVVTAASASGICDGAGSLVLASEAAVEKHGLKPLCELVSWSVVGVDPTRMGIGPVPAITAALSKAGIEMGAVDRVEINEAFAPQAMACAKDLGLDMSKLNVNGGAIALGHPLAASGSRITMHLAHAIARGEVATAVGSACIGGGQGIALVLRKA
jgi:acetyl-CoA acyltransferase 2